MVILSSSFSLRLLYHQHGWFSHAAGNVVPGAVPAKNRHEPLAGAESAGRALPRHVATLGFCRDTLFFLDHKDSSNDIPIFLWLTGLLSLSIMSIPIYSHIFLGELMFQTLLVSSHYFRSIDLFRGFTYYTIVFQPYTWDDWLRWLLYI
jgi:hypothetical protein